MCGTDLDCCTYDGMYLDNYRCGEPWTNHEDAQIGNAYIDAARASAMYRFTDIYGQNYWTPKIP